MHAFQLSISCTSDGTCTHVLSEPNYEQMHRFLPNIESVQCCKWPDTSLPLSLYFPWWPRWWSTVMLVFTTNYNHWGFNRCSKHNGCWLIWDMPDWNGGCRFALQLLLLQLLSVELSRSLCKLQLQTVHSTECFYSIYLDGEGVAQIGVNVTSPPLFLEIGKNCQCQHIYRLRQNKVLVWYFVTLSLSTWCLPQCYSLVKSSLLWQTAVIWAHNCTSSLICRATWSPFLPSPPSLTTHSPSFTACLYLMLL